jgi:hypothetical protein
MWNGNNIKLMILDLQLKLDSSSIAWPVHSLRMNNTKGHGVTDFMLTEPISEYLTSLVIEPMDEVVIRPNLCPYCYVLKHLKRHVQDLTTDQSTTGMNTTRIVLIPIDGYLRAHLGWVAGAVWSCCPWSCQMCGHGPCGKCIKVRLRL